MSMGFSRQEYWSGLPHPPPGDLPDPGSNLHLLHLLHQQVGSLLLVPSGSPSPLCPQHFTKVNVSCWSTLSSKVTLERLPGHQSQGSPSFSPSLHCYSLSAEGILFPARPRSEFISHTPAITWLWYFPNRYKFHKSAVFILFSSESLEVRKGKTNRILCIYMESRKMVFMNLFAGQQWRCRLREQTGFSGGRRGWDELREQH